MVVAPDIHPAPVAVLVPFAVIHTNTSYLVAAARFLNVTASLGTPARILTGIVMRLLELTPSPVGTKPTLTSVVFLIVTRTPMVWADGDPASAWTVAQA